MKKLIIDRFEGIYAVCEQDDKTNVRIPKYKIPLDCKEGDSLYIDFDGMYHKDSEDTRAREKRIREKMNRLFE